MTLVQHDEKEESEQAQEDRPTLQAAADVTGVPEPRRMTPESTKPTKAMNRPIPTLIAERREFGTARKIISRTPVRTKTRMRTPSHTTRPIAWDQVIVGATT